MTTFYRANFGDGTHGDAMLDIRDAKLRIWERAAIVQFRSFIETCETDYDPRRAETVWRMHSPSRAQLSGPPITEIRA